LIKRCTIKSSIRTPQKRKFSSTSQKIQTSSLTTLIILCESDVDAPEIDVRHTLMDLRARFGSQVVDQWVYQTQEDRWIRGKDPSILNYLLISNPHTNNFLIASPNEHSPFYAAP